MADLPIDGKGAAISLLSLGQHVISGVPPPPQVSEEDPFVRPLSPMSEIEEVNEGGALSDVSELTDLGDLEQPLEPVRNPRAFSLPNPEADPKHHILHTRFKMGTGMVPFPEDEDGHEKWDKKTRAAASKATKTESLNDFAEKVSHLVLYSPLNLSLPQLDDLYDEHGRRTRSDGFIHLGQNVISG